MSVRLQQITVAVMMMVLIVAGLAFAQDKVDINTADVKQLMSLKNVGEQKAQAIIKYRQMNGPFQSLDDFQRVPGIGEKTIASNKDRIIISQGTAGQKGTAASGKAKQAHSAQK